MPKTVVHITSIIAMAAVIVLGGNVHAQGELQRRLVVSAAMASYWCATKKYSNTFADEVWRGLARLLNATQDEVEDAKNIQVANRVLELLRRAPDCGLYLTQDESVKLLHPLFDNLIREGVLP